MNVLFAVMTGAVQTTSLVLVLTFVGLAVFGAVLQGYGHRGRGMGISADRLVDYERAVTLSRHYGSVWYVDSTKTSGGNNGTSWSDAFTTLQAAINAAAVDDTIMVAPLHAENVGSASAITVNKAGVSIVGLGQGHRRPTFTWSATGGTIVVSANDVSINNIVCTCSVDEVVSMWSVTGARVTFDKVDYKETASAQAIQFLVTTAAADYFTLRNCYHVQLTASAGNGKWIELVGIDGGVIECNTFRLVLSNNAASCTISMSTACLGTVVRHNTIVQTGGTNQVSAILCVDSSTGIMVHDNRVACGSTALAGGVDVGNAGYAAENYVLNTPDKSGLLDPAADA